MWQTLMGFPNDWLEDFANWQREVSRLFDDTNRPASIRSATRGHFPKVNIGATPEAVQVFAFAPGIDPQSLDIAYDNGILIIAGERQQDAQQASDHVNQYRHERFVGEFRRVVSLPDDIDPERIEAKYADGIIRITANKRETAVPRRIQIN